MFSENTLLYLKTGCYLTQVAFRLLSTGNRDKTETKYKRTCSKWMKELTLNSYPYGSLEFLVHIYFHMAPVLSLLSLRVARKIISAFEGLIVG